MKEEAALLVVALAMALINTAIVIQGLPVTPIEDTPEWIAQEQAQRDFNARQEERRRAVGRGRT